MTAPTSPPPAVTTQPAGGAYALTIVVHGTPAPQGSKRAYVRGGRAQLVESSAAVKPWREAVKWAAITAVRDYGQAGQLLGPLAVDVTFTLPRPRSLPKRVVWPATRPDIDKCARAALDALGDAGCVYADDGQVVDLHARKTYPGVGPDALPHPGAVIRIAQVTA